MSLRILSEVAQIRQTRNASSVTARPSPLRKSSDIVGGPPPALKADDIGQSGTRLEFSYSIPTKISTKILGESEWNWWD